MKKFFEITGTILLILIALYIGRCTAPKSTQIHKQDTVKTETTIDHWHQHQIIQQSKKPKATVITYRDTIYTDTGYRIRTLQALYTKDSTEVVNDSVSLKVLYSITSKDSILNIDKNIQIKVRVRTVVQNTLIQTYVKDKHQFFVGPEGSSTGLGVGLLYTRYEKVNYKVGLRYSNRNTLTGDFGIYWRLNK
jgi:hypothetical protein